MKSKKEETTQTKNTVVEKEKPYQCQINVQFPTARHALHAKEVLEVDREIGNESMKSFQVVSCNNDGVAIDGDNQEKTTCVLSVQIKATEAKLLRVSISSFYDMLNVFLKCHQEFS